VVLVEDLFYNLPARQKSFIANGSEYLRMVHIVTQYAVFHTSVGFSIRRIGRRPDLQTPAGASQLELIRQVTA
jgi:DNA mismatch repair ATPase MutL